MAANAALPLPAKSGTDLRPDVLRRRKDPVLHGGKSWPIASSPTAWARMQPTTCRSAGACRRYPPGLLRGHPSRYAAAQAARRADPA
jgi:hypothetical protein